MKVGPVINRSSLEKIHDFVQIGQDEGARLLAGGHIVSENGLDGGNSLCANNLYGCDA